jgi:aminopeptidase YwaD
MSKLFIPSFICCLLLSLGAKAQSWSDKETIPWLTDQVAILADTAMHGRGYVNGGREKAAAYLQKQFKKYHLKPVNPAKGYAQHYYFQVNTFPGKMELSLGGHMLNPGKDYIIDAKSASFSGTGMPVEKIDFSSVATKGQWTVILASFKSSSKVHYLDNIDDACKVLGVRRPAFLAFLPKGCYIIPQKEKFIWTVSRSQIKATIFYINSDSLQVPRVTADVHVQAKLLPKAKSDNIVGIVPGEIKDTFIAITAHYDHLGMMGDKAVFPGASDNASGSAMLLYLANYFQAHPQHYSLLFISFSGEEAGLMGSKYFTKHPTVPLKKIKFLTNIDIMGDASDGITVVNATEYPQHFRQLQDLNAANDYLPQVKSRGKAANSDHYYFTEAGVPSFFIYANGGKGYYHDIFDKAEELSMNKVDKIAQLLIDFLKGIK